MDPNILVSIYQGAASIATPLSLAALIASFFFFITRQIIEAIKEVLSKIMPEQAVLIILRILRYFFILSLVALVGGIACYATTFFLKDYVERQRLVDAAQDGVAGGDLYKIVSSADQLIKSNPKDFIGYKFMGQGLFMQGSFKESRDSFSQAIKLFPDGSDVCEAKLNALKGNLAAAQGASGEPEAGLLTLDEIDRCKPRPKMDAFNRAKMLIAIGKFEDAEKALNAPELFGPDRPDIRSRVWLERALVSVRRTEAGWEQNARKNISQAISMDGGLKNVFCSQDAQADPGWSKLQDFGLERAIIDAPETKDFFNTLRRERLSNCE